MINFPRLTMRNINRFALALALFAPIVYLFGTQFAALAGSHGERVLADSVSYETKSVKAESMLSLDLSTGAPSYDVRFRTTDYLGVLETSSYNLSSSGTVNGYSGAYRRVLFYDSDFGYLSYVQQSNSNLISFNNVYTFSCPANTSYLRVSYYVTASYTLENVTLTGSFPAVYDDYSSVLFGDMFYSDNFLVQWGDNAVSDNPVGFAPVGILFKYVDDNMLHFAENDTQWGMMIYGYLYWSAHVLLFDLVFYCGTFFITLFKNIVDKLGGVAE